MSVKSVMDTLSFRRAYIHYYLIKKSIFLMKFFLQFDRQERKKREKKEREGRRNIEKAKEKKRITSRKTE